MYVNGQTVITIAAILAAVITIIKYGAKAYGWFDKQDKQDIDIESMKEEQCMLCYGVLACLEGLKQLNCNGPVTEARDKLSKYINKKAHDQEGKK